MSTLMDCVELLQHGQLVPLVLLDGDRHGLGAEPVVFL